MVKRQFKYLNLPTKDAVELLRGAKAGAIFAEIYLYLRGKYPSIFVQEGGGHSGKEWMDWCISQVFLEYQSSELPLCDSINAAVDSFSREAKKSFNEYFYSNRSKIYQSEENQDVSFFDLEIISPDEANSYHLVNYFQPFVDFLNRIDGYSKISGNYDIKQELNDFRSFIGTWSTEVLKKMRKENPSVYEIAKRDRVDYRRLLYSLKKFGFPLAKLGARRWQYFIFPDRQPFFNFVYTKIKYIWEMEDNYRAWTKEFLSLGWSKSRTSQFMKRKIQSGLLPKWFFDCLPADNKILLCLVNADPRLKSLLELKNSFVLKSRRELTQELKKIVKEAKKTLLGSC